MEEQVPQGQRVIIKVQVLQRAMEAVEIHNRTHLERIEGILLKSGGGGGDGFLIRNKTFKDDLHKTKLVNIVNDQLRMDTEHYLCNKYI